MKSVILCSSNPILVKTLYGMLRDEGLSVELSDHPAFAVQKIIHRQYDFLILDSEPFGLSSEDAAQIIKTFAPGTHILLLGERAGNHAGFDMPLDLEKFKRAIQTLAV